jgi:hypothetical protein
MSISYSGLTNYGKATLPSVVGGLGSQNILRDPPRSIHTRRRDKVGETSSITEMIDQSGNRACEAISTYARGINPCVSVSYNNFGNNGGQNSGSLVGSGGTMASLPYKIMRNGAFRPPIIRAEQLMPLSRQPRVNTSAFTKPGFADFTKKMVCPGGKLRAIVESPLHTFIRPTATYKIETPINQPFEVKYVIKNPVKFDKEAGSSGKRFQDFVIQSNLEPYSHVNSDRMAIDSNINKSGDTVRYVDNSHLNTDKYIQDTLHSSVQSKRSKSIQINNSNLDTDRYLQDSLAHSVSSNKNRSAQITPIEDIMNLDIRTKDPLNFSYTAPKSSHDKQNYIHKDKELQRRVMRMTAATNKTRNIHYRPSTEHFRVQKRNRPIAHGSTNRGSMVYQSTNDINNRNYPLKKTINAGGMMIKGHVPSHVGSHDYPTLDSRRSQMNQRVMEMQHGRR